MRQLLEFLPLVLFFTAYQMDGDVLAVGKWSHRFDGIFSATAVLMISSVASWMLSSVWEKKNDRRLMWMAVAIMIFGAATLIFRDQRFIQCPVTTLIRPLKTRFQVWIAAAEKSSAHCWFTRSSTGL